MAPLIAAALGLAPVLLDALAGKRAGEVAGKVVDVVRDVTGSDDPGAIAGLPPEQRAALQERLVSIALEERRAELADVADARAQTVSLAQSGSSIAWAAPVISVVITAGFFGAVFLMLLSPQAYDERTAVLVNVVLAALTLGFAQVTNYWLGSSSGSKRSGDAVREMATRPLAMPAPPVAIATTGPVSTTDDLNAASLARARGNP